MAVPSKKILAQQPEPFSVEHGFGSRFQGFQNLMRYRIRDILLVSSLYDLYVFEEDGRLYELIRKEYQGLNLSHSPEIIRVSKGEEAIRRLKEEKRFDLIITTPHIEDMEATTLAKKVRKEHLNVPVVLLGYDDRELSELMTHQDVSVFDRIFVWTGNFRILIGIIKHLEDRMNVDHDARLVGVQCIILIEDNVRFYSSFLPILYTEILKQSQRLISEGINLTHKYLRMRARPKILLCTTYEEAWDYFEKYEEFVLGIISDIDFMHNGVQDPQAGIEFARNVRMRRRDIPILLQSNDPKNEEKVKGLHASFVLKDSPTLLQQVSQFTNQHFGFGDFIFRLENGQEVGRAHDLVSLEKMLKSVPAESIRFHASQNHFSNWLKARTEFWLAHKLRPRKVSDYPSVEALREDLVSSLRAYRKMQKRGLITDFSREGFDPNSGFARVGGGSLGGKARGLSFLNMLINNYNLPEHFEGTHIFVPPGLVIGTDVFDTFMDENDLRGFALKAENDNEILKKFLEASRFPKDIMTALEDFLSLVHEPLAVRSSSLLEDSQYHPFAGVYETYMIPNNNENPLVRLYELITAIKRVYASTFYKSAKDYIKMTAYRLEEEKMAVIIHKLVGSRHNNRFYPAVAGVAKSYNFYPVPPQKSEDGITSIAFGLGRTVVEGGNSVRFSPRYPHHLPQFHSIKETLRNNQREFYALDMEAQNEDPDQLHDICVRSYPLREAEKDQTLYFAASTYSHENNTIYDGISRPGARVITFAPILKHKIFPLPQILEMLLELGSWGMGSPVEIEFAVNMAVPPGKPKQFGLLQMRPMVLKREKEALKLSRYKNESLICQSPQVMGNGIIDDIYDVVMVDYHTFQRSKSKLVAEEVSRLNHKLVQEARPYLLIGVGRWGTLDPWLGIPVNWDQIAGAKAIVETSFKDFMVAPSQGSHFFQNITSFMVAYFTVNAFKKQGFIDWDWLLKQPALERLQFTRHIRFDAPLKIIINGQSNEGVIVKPV